MSSLIYQKIQMMIPINTVQQNIVTNGGFLHQGSHQKVSSVIESLLDSNTSASPSKKMLKTYSKWKSMSQEELVYAWQNLSSFTLIFSISTRSTKSQSSPTQCTNNPHHAAEKTHQMHKATAFLGLCQLTKLSRHWFRLRHNAVRDKRIETASQISLQGEQFTGCSFCIRDQG